MHVAHEELTVVPTSVDEEIELVRPSTPSTSVSGVWPEYTLDQAVDIEDERWAPYLQPCHDALASLGYAGPKHQKQLQAMLLVLEHRNNYVMVLPTGFGKTLLSQFIAKLPRDLTIESRVVGGNCIIISPFTALLMEQVEKCKPLNIAVFNWQDRGRTNDVPVETRLLFIQPESFISSTFQRCAFLCFVYLTMTYTCADGT